MSDKRFKDCIVLATLGNGTAYEMAYHGFLINRAVHSGQTYYKVTVPKTYDLSGAIRDLIDETIAYGVQIGKGGELKHNRDHFYQKADEIAYHCGYRHHVPVESIHDNARSGSFYKEFDKKVEAFDWIDQQREKFTLDYNLNPLADLQNSIVIFGGLLSTSYKIEMMCLISVKKQMTFRDKSKSFKTSLMKLRHLNTKVKPLCKDRRYHERY